MTTCLNSPFRSTPYQSHYQERHWGPAKGTQEYLFRDRFLVMLEKSIGSN